MKAEPESHQPTHPDLAAALQAAKREWKEAKQAKQKIARQFKDVQGDPAALEALKAQMQEASSTVDEKTAGLKALQKRAAAISDPEPPKVAGLPPRMMQRAPLGSAPADLCFEPLGEGNAAAWDDYVATNPRATLYHDSRWRGIICTTMKQRSLCTLAISNGRVVGVVPLYRLTSWLFGDFAVSVPYVNYGGPLGESSGVEEALLNHAHQQAMDMGLRHAEIRELYAREAWPGQAHKVSMILQLPDSPDELLSGVGAKVRAQVRRGAREGFQVTFGGRKLLDEFYQVFVRNMRDLGTPVYASQLFRDVLEAFPAEAELAIVRHKGKPVGCAFLLKHNEVMEIPWASTLRWTNRLGSNMFMYWQVLSRAIERECGYFDFGRSSRESGTFRFKEQWGAIPVAHHWHYLLPDGKDLPALNPDNPKYRLLINVWRRMPLVLTRVIGPHLVRNLP